MNDAVTVGLVLFLAAARWLPHLSTSLWLDETVTFWVVRDGLADALSRAAHYQPHPAYYVLLWLWTQLAGTSEVALRIPSLLAMLASCFVLAKLATSLTRDREIGLIAAIVFASTSDAFHESVDARSYALGLLVLVCLALCLVRWLDEGRWREACLCGLLAALLPHLHLFFALPYPALALYALLRWPHTRATGVQAVAVGLLLAAGALLYVPVGSSLAEHSDTLSFARAARWRDLFFVLMWVPPVAGLLAGSCASVVAASRTPGEPPAPSGASRTPFALPLDVGILLAAWMLIPLLLLFAASGLPDYSLFSRRYLMPTTPATALLYAVVMRRAVAPRARIVAVIVVALAAFVSYDRPPEDFRGLARAVREFSGRDASLPILFSTGLVEAEHEGWLRDPVRAEYLGSPAAYYPLGDNVIVTPRKIDGQPIARDIIDPILNDANRFAAVEWSAYGARILPWLVPEARDQGYRVEVRSFGTARVGFFARRPSRRQK